MSETEFKVGDLIWWAKVGTERKTEACPVCNRTCKVTVILGTGERVVTPCDYCGSGFDGPRGFVEVDTFHAAPVQERIDEVRVEQTTTERRVEYRVASGWVIRPSDVHPDEATARAVAEEKARGMAEEEDRRLRWKKNGSLKKVSWLVGYHRREAAEARKKAAYHEERAATVKARGKETP